MKNPGPIGLLFLLLFGCSHLEIPEEWLTPGPVASRSNRYASRSLHPLSYIRLPEAYPLVPLAPFTEIVDPDKYRMKKLRHQGVSMQQMKPIPALLCDPENPDSIDARWNITPLEPLPITSMITLSQERYIHIQLDNDIFNYTDRFFTNGIRAELITPGLRFNPLSHLLIPYWHPGKDYYGIRLVQNIYTPSTTKEDSLLPGDRPYAGYLYAGSCKISNDEIRKFRITSELQLGIIGPASLGGALQISFHTGTPQNHKPLGWESQIQNDLLLNYLVGIEKGVVTTDAFEINLKTEGSLGTVNTYLQGGIFLRVGRFNPYFSQLYFSKQSVTRQRGLRNWQWYIFCDLNGQLTGYDATLEGGLFNKTSVYTISPQSMNRLIFQGSAGIVFSFGGIQIKGEQFLLSPEFQNGWWHKWMSLGITVGF